MGENRHRSEKHRLASSNQVRQQLNHEYSPSGTHLSPLHPSATHACGGKTLTSCLETVSSRVYEMSLRIVSHFSGGGSRRGSPASCCGQVRGRRGRRRRHARGWRERLGVRERELCRTVGVALAASLEGLESRALLLPGLDLDGGRGRGGGCSRMDVGLERRRSRITGFSYTHQHGGGGKCAGEREEQLLQSS